MLEDLIFLNSNWVLVDEYFWFILIVIGYCDVLFIFIIIIFYSNTRNK